MVKLYYEKLGHMLKPLVPKFRSHLFAYLNDIAEKTGPREAEADGSSPDHQFRPPCA